MVSRPLILNKFFFFTIHAARASASAICKVVIAASNDMQSQSETAHRLMTGRQSAKFGNQSRIQQVMRYDVDAAREGILMTKEGTG